MTASQADPLLYLPDTCMLHVLEFVGTELYEPKEDNTSTFGWLKTPTPTDADGLRRLPSILAAARLYYHVAQISKSWKELADRLIQQPPFQVELNFDPLPEKKRTAAILWLARRQLCIGSFVQSHWVIDFPMSLFDWLLHHCQTKYLTQAHLLIGSFNPCYSLFATLAKTEVQTQHALQEILGMHCSNLTNIVWEVSVKEIGLLHSWNPFPPILSCLSSVKTMALHIRSDCACELPSHEFQTTFLPAVVQHCPSLQRLVLRWIGYSFSNIDDEQDRGDIFLQSTSLEELSLEDFQPWQHTIFYLDCPQLKICVCASNELADGRQQQVLGVDGDETSATTSCVLRRVTPTRPIQYMRPSLWIDFHPHPSLRDLHYALSYLVSEEHAAENARVPAQRIRPNRNGNKRRGTKAGETRHQRRQWRPLPRRQQWRR